MSAWARAHIVREELRSELGQRQGTASQGHSARAPGEKNTGQHSKQKKKTRTLELKPGRKGTSRNLIVSNM